ncbi:pyridoxamine 5'-phosphate oxidase family protein [Aphanothece sacrum]|uniref:Pyridoxamine 5'-phosphate oxidase-related FMN-binding protein n=1 Tax=Aphanothece sacrum FPU1 TaxID=1920663 RepID=A0A401IE33_APHSA|nr:pyridoxamine 5'-phosphate oxidase family protein [Aphanothece sacrum]GBF79542.1 pyridoxamine 5'-phosphate oxidase-related FMN-binding protein [Aphanothece sacrum FPU1]GBF86294.1 pyridoxamine 5'-phosphate oxidase-related FMN-binding protein [Aphanothece sacrum FPU3]
MPRKFTEIAFTPAVKEAQEKRGSRQIYAKFEQHGPDNDTVTPEIAQFIANLDGFYFGTVSSNGYPYIQFRGGNPGFLKVLSEKTVCFPDFRGNVQYITVGNLAENYKAFLFLMDYRHRQRLKIWGKARYIEGDKALIEKVRDHNDDTEIERVIVFDIEAWNWNCPQHIPVRYSQEEVDTLQAKITELEKIIADFNQ